MPWLAFLVFGIQVYLIYTFPELADESYYAFWGQSPSFFYVDHPPLIAWLYALGGRWVNLIAMPFFCYLAGISLIDMQGQLKDQKTENAIGSKQLSPWFFYCMMIATPLGLGSLVILTPDIPMLWAWCLGIYAWHFRKPLLMVLSIVMGLYSKLLFILTLWAFLSSWSLAQKKKILGLSALGLLPLLWGQFVFSQRFEQWSFQLSHRINHIHPSPMKGLLFMGEWGLFQLFLLTPFALKAFWLIKDQLFFSKQAHDRFFFKLFVPSFLFCVLLIPVLRVEGNWSALFALSLQAYFMLYIDQIKAVWHQKWQYIQLILLMLTLCFPIILKHLPLSLGPPRNPSALLQCIDQQLNQNALLLLPHEPIPLFTTRYQEMSLLLRQVTHLPKRIQALRYLRLEHQRMSQFDLFPELSIEHSNLPIKPYLLSIKPQHFNRFPSLCKQAIKLGQCTGDLYLCQGGVIP